MKLRLWVDIAEITASIAVVVTLVLLILQMRESDALERVQNSVRMAQWDAQVFVQSDQLPIIAAKIETARNHDYLVEFRKRYDLSVEEAGIWNRWLLLLWKGLEAEFLSTGPSERLADRIRAMAAYEDQRMLILPWVTSSNVLFVDEFSKYVDRLAKELPEKRP